MTWIMLWVLTGAGNGGSGGLNSTEFASKEYCEAAAVTAKEMVRSISKWADVRVECVPKGDK